MLDFLDLIKFILVSINAVVSIGVIPTVRVFIILIGLAYALHVYVCPQ